MLLSCQSLVREAGTWRCRACGVKSTTLARHLGRWPTPSFAALSDEQRRGFMASLDGQNAQGMAQMATEFLSKFESHTEDPAPA